MLKNAITQNLTTHLRFPKLELLRNLQIKKILNLKLKTHVRNRDFIQLIQHHASQPGKYSAVCILLLIPAVTNKQKLDPYFNCILNEIECSGTGF